MVLTAWRAAIIVFARLFAAQRDRGWALFSVYAESSSSHSSPS
jgi:hypothetical protein